MIIIGLCYWRMFRVVFCSFSFIFEGGYVLIQPKGKKKEINAESMWGEAEGFA